MDLFNNRWFKSAIQRKSDLLSFYTSAINTIMCINASKPEMVVRVYVGFGLSASERPK